MINLLLNGAFAGNLHEWSGTGTIDRSNGYPRLGCVSLAAGQSLGQRRDLAEDQLYNLHYFYRLTHGATLTASYGAGVSRVESGVNAVWREGLLSFALDTGANDEIAFTAAGGVVLVDTVTLLAGGLAVTRGQLAVMVAARLGTLATDAALAYAASTLGSEGNYTLAIDEALRAVGAVGDYGDPDVTRLAAEQVGDAVESARVTMLQQLRGAYALKTDVSLGPRRESYSQIATSIDAMIAGAGSARRVSVGRLGNGEWPR